MVFRFVVGLWFVVFNTGVDLQASVRINEVMASNGTTIADEDGDFEDWIELYNSGEVVVDLGGWGLSDDVDRPFRWVFPSGTFIGAGEYLLVWASGKDRNVDSLHADFSISASGEDIVLTRQDGTRSDLLPARAIPRDISVGRVPEGSEDWYFFETPTPGSENSEVAYTGRTAAPTFSRPAGFYNSGFTLDLSGPEGAVIVYTLDGSEPSLGALDGRRYSFVNTYPRATGMADSVPLLFGSVQTYVFDAPIVIAERSGDASVIASINTRFTELPIVPGENFFKITPVRARAYREGEIPSALVTASYLVHPDMAKLYGDLAVISLNLDAGALFDFEHGIYVPGKVAVDWRQAFPGIAWNPGRPANYSERGLAWEREAYLEVFSGSGAVLLSEGAGLRIHGGWSRGNRIKSFRLYARVGYGSDRFDFDAFGGLRQRGNPEMLLTSFSRLILRNSGGFNDWEFTYLRDAFAQSLVEHLLIASQAYRPAVKFINGEYWGLINIRERLDASYLAGHYGISEADAVILTTPLQLPMEVDTGASSDLDDFLAVMAFAEVSDLSDSANLEWIGQRVDLADLALNYVLQTYFNNKDWPDNNNDLWRERTSGWIEGAASGRDGRWRLFLYDTDFGFGGWNFPRTNRPLDRVVNLPQGSYRRSTVETNPVNRLFRSLVLKSPEFRNRFINTYADQLNSSFVTKRVIAQLDALEARIDPMRAEHNHRWQTNLRADPKMVEHAVSAPMDRRAELREVFALANERELKILADDTRGAIRVNTLRVEASLPGVVDPSKPYPWTGIYFQDVPIDLEALREPGHQFVGWVVSSTNGFGALNIGEPTYYSTEPVIQLSLTEDTTVEAVFEAIPLAEQPVAIHRWDFEDEVDLLGPSFTLGGGALAVDPGPETVVLSNTGADFATRHLRVNNPLWATVTFTLPTSGFEAITFDFLTRRSGQGAGVQTLSYTTDGESWIESATYSVLNESPQARSFDFSEIEEVADNPDFAVRLTFTQADGGVAGNHRFDDVILSGLALPGINLPPVVDQGALPELLSLTAGGAPLVLDLNDWFSDPDGDAITYAVVSVEPGAVAAGLDGGELTLVGVSAGEARVTVSGADAMNPATMAEVRVLVYPAPFVLDGANFRFDSWAADNAAGSYPGHMLFLQSGVADPGLTAVLNFAYAIPPEDAARPEDVGFPYAAESRSRINGRGEDGISFINTGRGRDVGSALVALDTTGVNEIEVSFTVGTILPNSRIYAISLQYRIGLEGEWSDVLVGGAPVRYLRNEMENHAQKFGPIRLPEALEDRGLVQLQWRYHYVEGTAGPRAQLRLDDIRVTSSGGVSGYAGWVAEHFPPAEASDPAVSGPAAAPLGDGVPNLLKYALGLLPGERVSSQQWEQGTTADNRFFIRFHRDPERTDIIYLVEASTDLSDWSERLFDSSTYLGENSHGEIHEVSVEIDGETRRFLRLRVTQD